MTIKHLVISGGGPSGINALGALKYLNEKAYWNIKDIKTIYATSAGSLLSVLLALKFDLDTITNYILNRPWHEAYPINVSKILDVYANKGLYNKVTDIFFKPFLDTRDLPLTITMKELFDYSNIDLHVFSVEIHEFKTIDISHNTHPNLPVLTAIHMSIAIPIIISPVCLEEEENDTESGKKITKSKCYVDRGIMNNYPLHHCLNQIPKPDINEVLGLRKRSTNETSIINKESNVLDFLVHFMNKLFAQIDTEQSQIHIPNEILYKNSRMNLQNLSSCLYSSDFKKELFNDGLQVAKEFLQAKEMEEKNTKEREEEKNTKEREEEDKDEEEEEDKDEEENKEENKKENKN